MRAFDDQIQAEESYEGRECIPKTPVDQSTSTTLYQKGAPNEGTVALQTTQSQSTPLDINALLSLGPPAEEIPIFEEMIPAQSTQLAHGSPT